MIECIMVTMGVGAYLIIGGFVARMVGGADEPGVILAWPVIGMIALLVWLVEGLASIGVWIHWWITSERRSTLPAAKVIRK